MERKFFKGLTTLLMVSIMLTTQVVYADNATLSGTGGYTEKELAALEIPKSVVVKNAEAGTYYGPNVTFSYTLTPASSGRLPRATETGNSNLVKAGVTGGATLSSSTLNFTNDEVSLESKSGGALYQNQITKNIVVTVDSTKFTTAGIYRYLLSDTTLIGTLYNAGITRTSDYKTERYLDVYIVNDANSNNESRKIAGYVLSDVIDDGSDTSIAGDKREGYSGSINDSGANVDTDIYVTYNVQLTQKVSGAMAEKNNEFPITVSVDNNRSGNGNTNLIYKYNTNENTNFTVINSNDDLKFDMDHGDILYIKGLSPLARIGYTETNSSNDTYQVTVTGKIGDNDPIQLVPSGNDANTECAPNGTVALTSGAVTNYANNYITNNNLQTEATLTNYGKVTYINILAGLSPTNFVLRYAPFIIIFGISIVVLILFRRKKEKKEDTTSI